MYSFKDKVVCIIGPAGYLETLQDEGVVARQLDCIRRADCVARVNVKVDDTLTKLVLPPNTTDRIDVVFHHGKPPGKSYQSYTKDGLKYVAMTMRNELSIQVLRAYTKYGTKHVIVDKRRPGVPNVSSITIRPFNYLTARVTTGQRAIRYVLRDKPAKLYVYGFDCYKSGIFRGYNEDYCGVDTSNWHFTQYGNGYHDIQREYEEFKKLCEGSEVIVIDELIVIRPGSWG